MKGGAGGMWKKNTNKGFSLVELMIGVTILAIIAVPLAHAFITSASMANKAAKLRSETLAAQNILESYEATNISAIIDKMKLGMNTSFAGGIIEQIEVPDADGSYTPVSFDTVEKDGPAYKITLSGMSADDEVYDAVLYVEANTSRYEDINNKEIVNAKPMSAVISQPEVFNNPDDIAARDFALKGMIDIYFNTDLQAIAGITNPDDLNDLDAAELAAVQNDLRDYFISHMKRTITIPIKAYPTTDDEETITLSCNATFKYTWAPGNFEIELPSGTYPDPYWKDNNGDYGIFLFYYPNKNLAPKADTIIIENLNNLEMNIYLVQQTQNPVEINQALKLYEDLPGVPADTAHIVSVASVYTNFECDLLYYRSGTNWRIKIPLDNKLGGQTQQNRIYVVKVDLFEGGSFADDASLDGDSFLASFDASSVE